MTEEDRPLTAMDTPHGSADGHFEGHEGTLYGARLSAPEVGDIWAGAAKRSVPKKDRDGFVKAIVGIPLAIVLFIMVAVVVAAIAFGLVGAIGAALGLSSAVVTVAAVILAFFVVSALFNLLGLF